jgi:hypothetical protein
MRPTSVSRRPPASIAEIPTSAALSDINLLFDRPKSDDDHAAHFAPAHHSLAPSAKPF